MRTGHQEQIANNFNYPFDSSNTKCTVGILSISEHYNRHTAKAFTGFIGFCCIVDDIVICDSDTSTYTEHIKTFLKHCAGKNIAIKCKFHQTKVTFAGFILFPHSQMLFLYSQPSVCTVYQLNRHIINSIKATPEYKEGFFAVTDAW